MVIKLYIDYMSQPARAVLALCIIANIPYEVVETSIMKMQVYLPKCRIVQKILLRSTL